MTRKARIAAIWLGVLLIISLIRCATGQPTPSEPHPSQPSMPAQAVYLNEFDGTSADLKDYYHTTEGPWLIPFSWFISLEMAQKPPQEPCDDTMLFASPESLSRLGFLLQPRDPATNPDGLPVGVIRSPTPRDYPPDHPFARLDKLHWLGVTCAFCHTGELRYKGKAFRVHGGQSMFDSLLFNEALGRALVDTQKTPKKFKCFAQRVIKLESGEDEGRLRDKVTDFLLFGANVNPPLKNKDTYQTPWGFGRIDAYGRGGNTLLAALIDNEPQVPFGQGDNRMVANASVSIPQIWWAWNYLWVQWNGSIEQPLSRNITAMTTASRRLLFNPKAPYQSDVDVAILHKLETLVRNIHPPRWPAAFDDDTDQEKNPADAKAGKALYGKLCVECHVPKETVIVKGKPFYNLTMKLVEDIGTDENQAKNFKERIVTTGRLEPILGKKTMPTYEFMQTYSDEIRKLEYQKRGISSGGADEMDGFRLNNWRDEFCEPSDKRRCGPAYMARPHAGVWATPPFLHNGSVPTIYALLSLPDEIDKETGEKNRPECFYVGPGIEYDPKRLGLVTRPCRNRPDQQDPRSFYDENGFKLDTRFSGNRNTGHEFRTAPKGTKGVVGPTLTDEERMQLLEYLKFCDLGQVWSKEDWDRIKDKAPQLCS